MYSICPTVIAIMLGSRDLADWQAKWQCNIKPSFGAQGPSLPGLREGSLYYAKDVNLFAFVYFILG